VKAKQVILIRKDLKMRRGKEIAQGSHASMEFLTRPLRNSANSNTATEASIALDPITVRWLDHGMPKVCLQVHSEDELLHHHQQALQKGLKSSLIKDAGKTEFHGVATYTACAIGPEEATAIDEITGTLSLY